MKKLQFQKIHLQHFSHSTTTDEKVKLTKNIAEIIGLYLQWRQLWFTDKNNFQAIVYKIQQLPHQKCAQRQEHFRLESTKVPIACQIWPNRGYFGWHFTGGKQSSKLIDYCFLNR